MFENATQITMGGILALLVLREVFNFLQNRHGVFNGRSDRPMTKNFASKSDVAQIVDRLDRLIELAKDQLKINRSLQRRVIEAGEAIERQARVLNRVDKNTEKSRGAFPHGETQQA